MCRYVQISREFEIKGNRIIEKRTWSLFEGEDEESATCIENKVILSKNRWMSFKNFKEQEENRDFFPNAPINLRFLEQLTPPVSEEYLKNIEMVMQQKGKNGN